MHFRLRASAEVSSAFDLFVESLASQTIDICKERPELTEEVARSAARQLYKRVRRSVALHEASHTTMAYRLCSGTVAEDGRVCAKAFDGGFAILTHDGNPEHSALMHAAGYLGSKLYMEEECILDTIGCNSDFQKILTHLHEVGGDENTIQKWTQTTIRILREPSVKSAILDLADALESVPVLFKGDVEKILAPRLEEWRALKTCIKEVTLSGACELAGGNSEKAFDVIKAGNRVVDYQNIRIRGYLSTFRHVTQADREGDYVEYGAFKETIPHFMRNPVLLVNHQNSVGTLAGRFTE